MEQMIAVFSIVIGILVSVFSFLFKSWIEGKDRIIQLRHENLELRFRNLEQQINTLVDEKQFNTEMKHIISDVDELKRQFADVRMDLKNLPDKMLQSIKQWKV
jgi:hypothetical protein